MTDLEALEISADPSRIDVALVCDFLATTYWGQGMPREVVERSIRNSLCFGAYFGMRQVAFARIVTDEAIFGYLADVFVVPEYRGKGIAKELMTAVVEHPQFEGSARVLASNS